MRPGIPERHQRYPKSAKFSGHYALGGSLGRTSPAQGSLETPSDPFHQGFAQGFLSGKALGGLGRPWAAQGKHQEKALGGLGRKFVR